MKNADSPIVRLVALSIVGGVAKALFAPRVVVRTPAAGDISSVAKVAGEAVTAALLKE